MGFGWVSWRRTSGKVSFWTAFGRREDSSAFAAAAEEEDVENKEKARFEMCAGEEASRR